MEAVLAISTADLEYARATLDGVANGAQIAIRSAINDTLKSGRTEWVRETKEHLNAPAAEIRKRIAITGRPTAFALAGTLTAKNDPIRFEDFKPKWSKSGGITVTGIKDLGPTIFPHGFRATMKSGHRGAYQRSKLNVFTSDTSAADLVKQGFAEHEAKSIFANNGGKAFLGRGIRHQKRIASGGNFVKVTPRGIAQRLPMKDLMGPSVVVAAEKVPELIPKVSKVIGDKFSDRLMSKIEWQLSKGKSTVPPDTASE